MNGGLVDEFINDKFKVTPWFTLITGLRLSQFNATISENAIDPRVGGALTIPRLNWVLQGFYGYYYQAPPLVTATGPLLDLANGQDLPFLRCMASGIFNGSWHHDSIPQLDLVRL